MKILNLKMRSLTILSLELQHLFQDSLSTALSLQIQSVA